jgi:hypothetical protein
MVVLLSQLAACRAHMPEARRVGQVLFHRQVAVHDVVLWHKAHLALVLLKLARPVRVW